MSSQPKYPERGTIPWDLALKAYIDSGDESEGGVGSVGPQGPEGPEGDPGAMGPMGDTGPIGPQGLKGDTGEQGPQGLKGDTGAQGPQGIQGVVGPTGLQGSAGTGITMKGSVATSAGLPATGNRGDAYIVQADDSLWVHDGTNLCRVVPSRVRLGLRVFKVSKARRERLDLGVQLVRPEQPEQPVLLEKQACGCWSYDVEGRLGQWQYLCQG
jgi:hypothetical protein